MKLHWSPRALGQVEAAFDFIADDRPQAAAEWLNALFERVRLLREFSTQGRYLPEAKRDDLRELIYGSYRIVYRVDPEDVIILLVHHARMPMVVDDAEVIEYPASV